MRIKSKGFLSALLVLAMVVGMLGIMPMTAFAAEQTFTIQPSDNADIAAMQSTIQTVIDSNDVVYITGGTTGVAATLTLNIPAGKTVVWRADYSGSVATALISINNSGLLVVESGSIKNNGAGVALDAAGTNSNVTVSGGTVSADINNAITGRSDNVINITGGTVISGATKAAGGTVQSSGTVNISGNCSIENRSTGYAIYTSGDVNLSGGTVSATTGTAIEAGAIIVASGTPAVNGKVNITSTAGNINVTGGALTITGDVTCTGASSFIQALSGGKINITGVVTTNAHTPGPPINVIIIANGAGVEITIGSVATSGDGVFAGNGGKVYITGTLTAAGDDIYIAATTLAAGTPTTANGHTEGGYYWDVYTDAAVTPQSYVYIRKGAATAPSITTATLPGGTVGTAYNQTLAATGDTPITWSVDSGSLPGGMSLSTAGVISGTPTTAGTFNFTVKATNGAGNVTKALSIVIGGGAGHTHTPGTAWQKDAISHWHACGGCTDKLNFAAHTPGAWIVDVAATATTNGNRHKECTVCGYTTDTEIIPATGGTTVVYNIINGANGSWTKGTAAGPSITSDGAFGKFLGVKMDGNTINAEHYTAVSGSTIVTFKAAYLETLAVGEHTVELIFVDGSATTKLTIRAADSTTQITGLPTSYTLYTGGRVSWTPAPTGGTWSYNGDYLSMTQSGGTYTFKALKKGTTTAIYTMNGVSHAVSVTINESTLPQTGDSANPLPWVLLMIAGLYGAGTVLLYRKKRAHEKA